jgi:hypothetical protein
MASMIFTRRDNPKLLSDHVLTIFRSSCGSGGGPGIDSRLAVLALITGLGANTANLESIQGPIQKQPVSNTITWKSTRNDM